MSVFRNITSRWLTAKAASRAIVKRCLYSAALKLKPLNLPSVRPDCQKFRPNPTHSAAPTAEVQPAAQGTRSLSGKEDKDVSI